MTDRDAYDVIVIGAGPAGMAAATETARAGLTTLLVDENPAEGGQIHRAVTTTPLKDRAILGPEFWRGEDLARDLRASGAEMRSATTVWSLNPALTVGLSHTGTAQLVSARRVIIATGSLERPFPIPGWTLPGVMTAGAAQTLLKSAGMVPLGRVVLAGTGPLLWLLAAQITRAGGTIDRILDTTPAENRERAMKHALNFLFSRYALKGLRLMREVSRKVPISTGITRLAASGSDRLREVHYTKRRKTEVISADLLLLHQGVVPHVNLAMAAGARHVWDDLRLCWTPVVDRFGNSSVPGIAIAGDGAGIAGAEAAVERGRLAAIDAVIALRPAAAASLPDVDTVAAALARAEVGRAFLDHLFRPADAFRIPAQDDVVVCRCEEVTAGDIRTAIAVGAIGPNQLKAQRCCGMGPCQGRLCGLTVTELIAAERGVPPEQVGHFRLRAPVKPITVAEMASIPSNPAALGAVVRG